MKSQFFVEACPSWSSDVAKVEEKVCDEIVQKEAEANRAQIAIQEAEAAKPACARLPESDKQYVAKETNRDLDREIQAGMDINYADANLEGLRKHIASIQQRVEVLRCLGDDASATRWMPVIAQWGAAIEERIVEEERCRADVECMFARNVIDELCGTIGGRADVLAEIKQTKRLAKRVGVIDLSELHDLGEQLEMSEERISELQSEYRAHTKKAFSASICKQRGF